MRDPSWFGRRCQCCARCGGHLFEYFFSPDGHFGLLNVLENAPRQSTVAAVDAVTILAPTHPLAGLTLPRGGRATTRRRGRVCVVRLHSGLDRLVPLGATNLAEVVPAPAPCRLAVFARTPLRAALGLSM